MHRLLPVVHSGMGVERRVLRAIRAIKVRRAMEQHLSPSKDAGPFLDRLPLAGNAPSRLPHIPQESKAERSLRALEVVIKRRCGVGLAVQILGSEKPLF